MMMMVVMMKYNTNTCNMFVALIRFMKGDDDDHGDDDEYIYVYNE